MTIRHRLHLTTKTIKEAYPHFFKSLPSTTAAFVYGVLIGGDGEAGHAHLRALDTIMQGTGKSGIVEVKRYLKLHGILVAPPPNRVKP